MDPFLARQTGSGIVSVWKVCGGRCPANTFIDLGVLNLEIFLTGVAGGVGYAVFKGISFLCATTNSFFWNKYWTFSAKEAATSAETGKFFIFALIGWGINVGLATFVVNGLARPLSLNPRVWANIAHYAVLRRFSVGFRGLQILCVQEIRAFIMSYGKRSV